MTESQRIIAELKQIAERQNELLDLMAENIKQRIRLLGELK